MTWKKWVHYFFCGRTHVAYALIVASGLMFFELVTQIELIPVLEIAIVLVAGSLVDSTAHLYYH